MKKSSGTTVSGFKKQIFLPLALLTAKLFAQEKPTLCLLLIKITSEKNDSITSIVSSFELLSTTIISDFILFKESLRLLKHNSRKNLEL